MVTLYVGGLSPQTTEADLAAMFGEFGEAPRLRLVSSDDGQSRGFAYVTFKSDTAAARARASLDGRELEGSKLRVALAT